MRNLNSLTVMSPRAGKKIGPFLFILLAFAASIGAYAQKATASLSFVVSIKEPSSHLYHVEFHCEGIKKNAIEFKMPAWTPGYYQLLDFAGNVAKESSYTIIRMANPGALQSVILKSWLGDSDK